MVRKDDPAEILLEIIKVAAVVIIGYIIIKALLSVV